MAALVFGFAILIENRLTKRRASQIVDNSLSEEWIGGDANELASLSELEQLINEQDRYFGLQLAIALREKARHFPIRIADIQELRVVLDSPNGNGKEAVSAQVTHLTRIIERLDNGYVD